LLSIMAAACSTGLAWAEITSLAASVSAFIQEFNYGQATRIDQAEDQFSPTAGALPLQVLARLTQVDQLAAGSVAAQFADPRTLPGPNPEEFAMSLALNSLGPDTSYAAMASIEEVRTVRFDSAEVGGRPSGSTVRLRGRVYLDGALALFAARTIEDLTGVNVGVTVTITAEMEGRDPRQVFFGKLSLAGGPNFQVISDVAGDLPTAGILENDLAETDPNLRVFQVLVFPNLVIDYPYQAVVGKPLVLRAVVQLEASNQPNGIGVAAVLGTPFQTLEEVIGTTAGEAAAKQMADTLRAERNGPTGRPAFDALPGRRQPLAAGCGLLGLESVIALLLSRAAGLAVRRTVAR